VIRLFVIVEGDTEQEFVKHGLAPHLELREGAKRPGPESEEDEG
jgi:hypothetical protein